MRKQTILIPTLSALLFSTAILSNKVYADEANAAKQADAQADSIQLANSGQATGIEEPAAGPEATSEKTIAAKSNEKNLTTELLASEANTQNKQEQETPITPKASATEIAVETASKSDSDITIIHTNDVHGRLVEDDKNGVIGDAKLANIVKKSRQQGETLVFDAGDAFQGLPISNSSQGEAMADVMNTIGYDAMTVGNHEFDFGLYQLKRLKEKLQFPIISSNIYVNGARLFAPSTIIDKTPNQDGDEFVVIGVTTPETATKTHPNNIKGVTFADPITEVNNVIAQTEAQARAEGKQYHNYVILSHLGVDATTKKEWRGDSLAHALANNKLLKGKNVILIDGHSHTVLHLNDGNVTYNQTGSYLNNVGHITLNSERVLSAGVITAEQAMTVTPDPAVAGLLERIQAKYLAESSKVVRANSPVELNGDRMNVRVRQTNLGDAVADSLLAYGQTGFKHKSNLAATNGGGLRETIKQDQPITKGDITAVLPFGNSVAQIKVTGQNILDMFKTSLGSITQLDSSGQPILDEADNPLLEPSGGFLQVAGARVYYDTNLAADQRILGIQIWDPESDSYLALDLSKTYYLATNDFLAAGGDDYSMLGGPREEGPSMDQVFTDYLKSDVDLSQYKEVTPNDRVISISATHYYDKDWIKRHIRQPHRIPKLSPLKPKPAPAPNRGSNGKPDPSNQLSIPKKDETADLAGLPDKNKTDKDLVQSKADSISDTIKEMDKQLEINKTLDDLKKAKDDPKSQSDNAAIEGNKPASGKVDLPDVSSPAAGNAGGSGSNSGGQSGTGPADSNLEASSRPSGTRTDVATNNRFNEILVSVVGVTIIAAGAVADHLRVRRRK
ncbi:putative 5'-nucleotidase precursor [Streptococcus criceti]|uniref:5'-nucleotidase family protein n=1 Tax=Streptococcus criceti HS-6 TaxID=873449 RepID=G5JR11_STRCG|nr:5'-nucleotidase C-terminal domain-containing protein [Streptococcus criceti]EHI74627.1 5'-nucleotidase family protein [Streptococcus criceti HS-6]SUN43011.1 putative 5'-nucleotidase precursor [Streptococcus criceti]